MHNISALIAPNYPKKLFKKRSILLYQGEAPRTAYVLTRGIVKMYSINNSGDELVVYLYGPGDFFPTNWVFKQSSTSLYYYETVTDCEGYMLSRQALEDLIRRPELSNDALNYFVAQHTGLLMRVTALEQVRAREKILFTFYFLLYRYGKEGRDGLYTINFPLTHRVIASLVGLTRETISAEIGRLRKQKVLDYKSSTYTINKPALEKVLGEDEFKDLIL